MATNKSMASRIQRVQAAARKKKIAELESAASASPRKQKIAELEAALKQAEGVKSKSTDKDDGKGKKPGATASEKYDRKKVQPKTKGTKSDAKLDKATGDAEPVGYPFNNGDTKGNLGKGKPKADSKKSKQTALNDADKKRKELTSETPDLKKTPKPKLSSADRKDWRKAKIAELKQALLSGQAPDSEMDADEVAPGDMQDVTGKATKEQRVPAAQVLQQAQKLIPALTQQLQQANDMLEDAVMGSDLQKIKGALTFLLTKIQQITKGQIVPLGATIRKLMSTLSPKQASSEKYASLVQGAHMVAKLDDEFSRSKLLMRMAANRITL
jgi:hypothetical protein